MKRDPRVRRAHLLAGILAGLIAGTAHALVVHVSSRPPEPSTATARAPESPAPVFDHDRRR